MYTKVLSYLDVTTVIFEQEFPLGANETNASHATYPNASGSRAMPPDPGMYPPILNFPSFNVDSIAKMRKLGCVSWFGVMVQIDYKGLCTPEKQLQGLSSSGPLAIHDDINTLVISPMDNFKSAVHYWDPKGMNWETGVNSELESLPKGFKHRTVLQLGQGITSTMDSWGALMRNAYNTTREIAKDDPVVNYLSYWTDNGAYYYGDKWGDKGGGGNPANETALRAVASALKSKDLLSAVKIWQLDDWWYPGHQSVYVYCVQNWTLGKGFNSTLAELSAAFDTPWLLYVPFFCPGNAYKAQGFQFLNSSNGPFTFAEPDPKNGNALKFYQMLFDYGIQNGMKGYENDFLNFNLLSMPEFRTVFGASDAWLSSINTAAEEREIPVQMCMALPSDLLASLQFNAVTNYRASTDYASGGNWDIGGSALLAYALGLRPSKDNFWTHRPLSTLESNMPWPASGNPGSNCELNTIIATLSTGPVGIADKAGLTPSQPQPQP